MSTLNLVGIALGLLAVLFLCFGESDGVFFGLLALACLFGSMGEAYREDKPGAVVWLIAGGVCAAVALRATLTGSRKDDGR